jgi:hypothetical protein
MTDIQMPPGPPCDVCGDEPAVMSIYNYADYQQLKLGGQCAPNVMRGIADAMDGGHTAEPEPEPGTVQATVTGPPPEGMTVAGVAAELADDAEGSAADHWASTTHVRRSTHGHRKPRGATAETRREEAE